MYWSAHVGTQENGWHDFMKMLHNATQSSNNISHDPIAAAIGNKNYTFQFTFTAFTASLASLRCCVSFGVIAPTQCTYVGSSAIFSLP